MVKSGRWVAKLERLVAKLGILLPKLGRWVAKSGRLVAKLGRLSCHFLRNLSGFQSRQLSKIKEMSDEKEYKTYKSILVN